MSSSTPRRRTSILLVTLTVLLALVGCGRDRAGAETVNLEGVSTPGENPFSPAVGTDQANVTPPANSGGSFPGNTVGLFGGTRNAMSCDKAKMVDFLQQDRAKAAAWAGVLGISVDNIQAFVASLTPAILRSDTRVMNHGFKDGRATEVPAILQAGTAVFVDVHGAPVTKCFCGNPLTPPAFTVANLRGAKWANFNEQNVTVIAPVTQTVQQFVIVQPGTNQAFQRPAGSAGQADTVASVPAPSTFAPPPSPIPSTITGPVGPASTPPPPGVVVPSPSVSPTPSVSLPSLTPTSAAPSATPSTTLLSSSPGPRPSSPAPSRAAPSVVPPVPSPGAPTPSGSVPPTATPASPSAVSPSAQSPSAVSPSAPSPSSATPSGTPSPTAPGVVRASWVVGDCFVRAGQAHGLVEIRPDGTTPQTFTVTVRLGVESSPVAVETVRIPAAPGQVARGDVTAPTSTPDGAVQCAVLSVMDSNGRPVVMGEPLPPPPDSNPMPAQPGPGLPSGPSVPVTPPPAVVPGGSHT